MQTTKMLGSGLAVLAVVGFVSAASAQVQQQPMSNGPTVQSITPSNGNTQADRQRTDGDGPSQVGPGSQAYKQRTDGDGLTQVGPGSGAGMKQRTDGEGITQVGPGSKAYKQQ